MKRLCFRSICHNLNFQKLQKFQHSKSCLRYPSVLWETVRTGSQPLNMRPPRDIVTPPCVRRHWNPGILLWDHFLYRFVIKFCRHPELTSTVTHQSRTENYFSQIGRSNHRQRRMAPKTMLTRESIASYFGDHLQCGISFCTNSVTYRKLNHIKFPHKMFDIFL